MDQQLSTERLMKLVADAQANKEENFEQLYAELLPLVYYRSLVLLNDRDEAQKVAQVCFVHLYKHIDELKDFDHFEPWLNAVITSACRGMLQARKHEHDISAELGHDVLAALLGGTESYSPDEALEAHEADEQTWAAIQALSQKQKEVILLYYIEGLSVDDIARILGISYPAARSRLFKARRRLLVLLEGAQEKTAVVGPVQQGLDVALERMDALIILPFLARQLTHFELSPRFGELGASIAKLIPAQHSLLTVASTIWSNVAREVGLSALSAATPTIAGTAISASQASAVTVQGAALPKAAGVVKLIPRLARQLRSNPAQAVAVGVASVAVVAGVAVGGAALLSSSPASAPAPQAKVASEVAAELTVPEAAAEQAQDTATQAQDQTQTQNQTTTRSLRRTTQPSSPPQPAAVPAAPQPSQPSQPGSHVTTGTPGNNGHGSGPGPSLPPTPTPGPLLPGIPIMP